MKPEEEGGVENHPRDRRPVQLVSMGVTVIVTERVVTT